MWKRIRRVLNISWQWRMRFLHNALTVGALTICSIATAEFDNTYFLLGISTYKDLNTNSLMKDLTDEFPGHTIFVARNCRRFCDERDSHEPNSGSLALGVGYLPNGTDCIGTVLGEWS